MKIQFKLQPFSKFWLNVVSEKAVKIIATFGNKVLM